MKKLVPILAACLFITVSFAFGQNQRIIPLSSEVYDEMDALYLLMGLGSPSAARPWTTSEARLILERIDSQSLTQKEQGLYDRVAAEVFKSFRFPLDSAAGFGAQLDLALEAYTHTNTDDFVLSSDWNYGYEKRQPLAKLSLEMGLYSWLYITTDLEYNRNRFNYRDESRAVRDLAPNVGIGGATSFSDPYLFPWRSWTYSKAFTTNIASQTGEFDFDWPKRANITFGGEHWKLSLARDNIQWGGAKTGNFVVDSHRDYDEYFCFSAYSERFKYEWLNVFYPDPAADTQGNFKLLMAHRRVFRFLPSLVLAVSENIMCRPNGFSPHNLNPAFIYHNWYDRDNFNSIAQLELDFSPHKGYRFYSQAVFDQIQAPWENGDEPSSWGILLGLEHTRPASSGFLSLSLEGAYTSPLLYRRDLVDFITLGVTELTRVDQNLALDYTGFPYGGDAMVLQFDAKYRLPGTAIFYGRLFGMIHGRMNFFVSHNKDGDNTKFANLKDQTPSGSEDEREQTFGITLGGNYSIPQPVTWVKITAWAEMDYINKKNKLMISETGKGKDVFYHKEGSVSDFQLAMGIGLSF